MSISIANAVPAPCRRAENGPRHSEKRGKRPGIGAVRAVTQENSDVTIDAASVSNTFHIFHLKHSFETSNRNMKLDMALAAG
ncbi:hypothetical protein GCN74_17760 [Janthinobacterium sp. FT14W]|uniref:hypothetical protein n=1 Tax=Janthinobacterium sp. FT14W TaxID=2654253 RepID=UPI0012644AD0|nr:hypothetical protein [Janthinobacterium sp. FT14W]KAB8058069.1 hypothetical protein GCN74_17760 [Janthinobacterium sp. FT14W]